MNQALVEEIYPLSPAQQGMFLHSLSDLKSELYIEQSCVPYEGPVERTTFERAWQLAMERHPILRTAFVAEDLGEPLQVVFKQVPLAIEWVDWSVLSHQAQEERLLAWLAADRQRGFIVSQAPLMRLAMVRTRETAYTLIWTHHHLLLDGWSAALLLKEVWAHYGLLRRGEPPGEEPPRPYRDYIAWLQRQDRRKAEAFWRRTLRGFRKPTPLGAGVETVFSDETGRYGQREQRLAEAITSGLERVSREIRVTLNTLIQGAWALLLSRYSGELDVVMGTTVAGRPAELAGVESMVGLFINTLPLRIQVMPQARLRDWLPTIQVKHSEARGYEHCSSGQIHQWSEMPGALPLYESILVFQNYPVETKPISRPERENRAGRFVGARTEYPLTLLAGVNRELIVRMVYDSQRIDPGSLDPIFQHLWTVFQAMTNDLDLPLERLLERIPGDQRPKVKPLRALEMRGKKEGFLRPETPTEKALAKLWAEILGLTEVAADDDFFDLKGHSLLAMQLISRVRDTFQVEIPLNRLFEGPKLSQFAATIEAAILEEIESLSEEEARRLVDEDSQPHS
jgi:acyl carrier protein